MQIHPSSIIDPTAKIHESVVIGPFTVIEAHVEIDEGTVIESCVRIGTHTKIGKNNHIFHTAAVGGIPQDINFKPETITYTQIGDNNVIREGVTIHRATKPGGATVIGNKNFIMAQTHIAHDCQLGNEIAIVTNGQIAGHVRVDDHAFISVAAVHQFCRVGEFTMLAGYAKVVKDVPPYCLIDGNPATIIGVNAVGMKRAGFDSSTRDKIKKAYKLIYHSGMNTKQALAKLIEENDPSPQIQKIIEFVSNSDRGITDHRPIRKSEE
ncbi:MAG: acyl-ACP--UDP-N-acetylglucosamine O-acyltransferase [Leptospiraceae bacterium]|nr:acyl-ACP--UDP-N-acetylglucosamine O-acyltransferase [Leptospiraceae bacterium]MCP5513752.1 acyl-ACP--UDP-N-acetylglucosamine O-acyltransferase [Leptospiraceae bacterium]